MMIRLLILLALLWPVASWGATAPTFVQEAEIAWTTGASATRTTGSFTVQSGDVLVLVGVTEDVDSITFGNLPTNTNTAFAWTQRQLFATTGDWTGIGIFTATATAGQSMTVSITATGGSATNGAWGFNVYTFRGSDGIGASSITNAAGGPSLGLTTTTDNAAIIVVSGDWNAADGASRTWRTVNSITPTSGNGMEQTYFRDAAHYTLYSAYYTDAGAAGSKTVGLSAPTGQNYVIAAIEVKGTAGGGGGGAVPRLMLMGVGP